MARAGQPGTAAGHRAAVADVRVAEGKWLARGTDGRLTAFAFAAEGVLRWTERRVGSPEWDGPELLPLPGLTHLVVGQGANGYAHLVGRRSVAKADGPPAVDIVHAVQYQTGRALGSFRPLGNWHTKDRGYIARFGTPVVAVDDGGTVHIVVRNAPGGLALRREDKTGKWEGWKNLRGSKLHDRPAAVATSAGTVEVLAPGEAPAGYWVRDKPHGAFERRPDIPLSVLPGSVRGLETSPGRVTFYWTDPANGGLVAHRPGSWLIPMGGAPADDSLTVLRATVDGEDCAVFAYRDAAGQVVAAKCGSEEEQNGLWWAPTGLTASGSPCLAVDGTGRVTLGAFGADGRPRISRRNDEPGMVMGPALTV
ncbi:MULTISPECIES: hypothetical protein [unclassified Streptomyces]|uniref:hypothetical protein n=1 Tax=unclassified Streptomyces TaxID=2593676 RepID=UPI0023B9D4E2|nr:hypothetical protein [Streptomyces sp. AM 3-1-1]WEH30426.1 hypothetical protein P0D76_25610 [Streptomyces sp. AM 3-1-1]